MTIDANLIEGAKIGFAAGFFVGAAVIFVVSLAVFYGMREKIKRTIPHV